MKTILIVEDEYDLKEALRIRLEGEGFKIHSAGNAARGLEIAREVLPDLIIMDVVLPGLIDGLRATYIIKHEEQIKGTPVIILTAKAAEEDKRHGLREGADVYMTKPFEHEELLAAIRSLLGEK